CWPDQASAGAGSWLTPVVGDYVLTAENLITGSLADDDVAMGGYHIGIHRPSRSGWRWDCSRPATGGGLHGGDHARVRRPPTGRHRSPAWSVPHGRLQPCPGRETAPARPVAFGASASSFEPDVREPEVHTASGRACGRSDRGSREGRGRSAPERDIQVAGRAP